MSPLQNFSNLARLALEPLSYPTSIGAVALLLAAWRVGLIRHRRWRTHYWWAFAHLLVFPVGIAIGALFAAGGSSHNDHWIAQGVLSGLLYCSLGWCLFWIVRMEGIRLFASVLMITTELPVLLGLFVAGMSVSGDWL